MLKFKITKEEYGALDSETLKALYVERSGEYHLDADVTTSDDFKKIQKNKNEILDEKKLEEKARRELQALAEQRKIDDLEKGKEYQKLLEIKSNKFDSDLAESRNATAALQAQLEKTLLSATVDNLAVALGGANSALLKPHIMARLAMRDVDGKLQLFVLDVAGNVSALTPEQLGDEFKNNPAFAPILAGRNSSGGGGQAGSGGSGDGVSEYEVHFKPETRNMTKQNELRIKDPELYKTLIAKYLTKHVRQHFITG